MISFLIDNFFNSFKLKVLFVDNSLWGLLNFRLEVIEAFVRRNHDVVLVAPKDEMSDVNKIPLKVKYIPVKLNRTGMNPFEDFRYYKKLKKLYKLERPNYIFHFTIKPNIYGVLAAHSLGIRCSAMIAGLGHIYTQESLKNSLIRFIYKYALRYVEYIIVLNKSNLEVLEKHKIANADKIVWFIGGEGVNLLKFPFLPLENHNKPIFLMICRLLYEKGYAEYVETARSLKEVAEFRIMGPIDSHPTAVKRATVDADVANGIIKYIEYSPYVIDEIKQIDCIVLPSYGEGLSRVLMEGLAMGRPIITTDIPGCRETVNEGVNGFICKPRDVDTLQNACKSFISLTFEQKVEMGKESRLLAEKLFDVTNVINSYFEILGGN